MEEPVDSEPHHSPPLTLLRRLPVPFRVSFLVSPADFEGHNLEDLKVASASFLDHPCPGHVFLIPPRAQSPKMPYNNGRCDDALVTTGYSSVFPLCSSRLRSWASVNERTTYDIQRRKLPSMWHTMYKQDDGGGGVDGDGAVCWRLSKSSWKLLNHETAEHRKQT